METAADQASDLLKSLANRHRLLFFANWSMLNGRWAISPPFWAAQFDGLSAPRAVAQGRLVQRGGGQRSFTRLPRRRRSGSWRPVRHLLRAHTDVCRCRPGASRPGRRPDDRGDQPSSADIAQQHEQPCPHTPGPVELEPAEVNAGMAPAKARAGRRARAQRDRGANAFPGRCCCRCPASIRRRCRRARWC